ncbi:MAG: hypothetical protein ACR5LD_03215 [Symbiopectobacterium sp.]
MMVPHDKVFVQPYLAIAKLLQRDPLNAMMGFACRGGALGQQRVSVNQNGQVWWYVASMGVRGGCGAGIVTVYLMACHLMTDYQMKQCREINMMKDTQ